MACSKLPNVLRLFSSGRHRLFHSAASLSARGGPRYSYYERRTEMPPVSGLYLGAAATREAPSAKPSLTVSLFSRHHFDKVHSLLKNSFLRDEPVGKAVGLTEVDTEESFKNYTEAGLKSDASFVAFDGRYDKLVGCAIRTIQLRGSAPIENEFNEALYTPQVQVIRRFMKHMDGEIMDLVPSVNKLMKFQIMAVDRRHRGRNIGRLLAEASLVRARELGCEAAAVVATSFKSQNLFNSLGFETLKTVDLLNYKDPATNSCPFTKMPSENRFAKLMIKYL